MRRGSLVLLVTLLGTGACNGGSPASPRLDASQPDGESEASRPDAAGDENPGSGDAAADAQADDAEAGYAVCPEALDATFGSIYGSILSPEAGSCGAVGFGCHSTIGAKESRNMLDFSLDAAAVYAELLGDGGGYPASNIAGDAGHVVLRVAPFDAGASMLYIKLTLTQNDPRYGAGMPLYTPGSICPAALQAIEQWIDTGAAR